MKWGTLFAVTLIIMIILLFQWPKMKEKPKRDKKALIVLLLLSWFLSMFNLPQTAGPLTLAEAIFSPIGQFMKK